VSHVKIYENQMNDLKRDLLMLRQAAKRQQSVPRFHYETKSFPSMDICPDIPEDELELTIVRVIQAKMPSGYEDGDAFIFVHYEFAFPVESPQSGKTKVINGTSSPVFSDKFSLRIDRKARPLLRTIKRYGIKFEVFQKGGFLRSDKLLGTCDCKLSTLESSSQLHESLDLMDGRKQIGGKLEVKIRIREALVEKKMSIVREKWLIIDDYAQSSAQLRPKKVIAEV